ncbi:MAG: hypothetical protein ACRD2W_05090 [Acidimicrobiales bacterium]
MAFREKDRVEAADDKLRGVPRGTAGTVIGVSGLDWIRYRVQFDNGWEHNLVHENRLRALAPNHS